MIKSLVLAATVFAASATSSMAALINFDDQGLTGPSFFSDAPAADVVIVADGVTVTFSGGGILTATSNLPANQTSLYGTASFQNGGLNPISISFSQSISNFFLDVINGLAGTIEYVVADNNGNSQSFSLAPNGNSGATTIGIAATGTEVTIFSNMVGTFDFFVDNIRFNEALPPDLVPVPLPAGLPLLVGALAGLGLLRRRKTAA